MYVSLSFSSFNCHIYLVQILPPAMKCAAWAVFQSLLDAISCRVHRHLHTQSTLQLIPNLASAAKSPILPNQLYMRWVI